MTTASQFRKQNRPSSSPAITPRVWQDLTDIAAVMAERQRPPYEMWRVLVRRAALWRAEGARVPDGAALAAVRSISGLVRYALDTDPDAFAEGIELPSDGERDRCRRAWILATWLYRYAGSASAEAAVRAVERDIVARLEAI